jgi:hypothetical protein
MKETHPMTTTETIRTLSIAAFAILGGVVLLISLSLVVFWLGCVIL